MKNEITTYDVLSRKFEMMRNEECGLGPVSGSSDLFEEICDVEKRGGEVSTGDFCYSIDDEENYFIDELRQRKLDVMKLGMSEIKETIINNAYTRLNECQPGFGGDDYFMYDSQKTMEELIAKLTE